MLLVVDGERQTGGRQICNVWIEGRHSAWGV
jgi:hypothetical protein